MSNTLLPFPVNPHVKATLYTSTTSCTESVRLVLNLKAAGMAVDANVLCLSKEEKEALVCTFMGWDMSREQLYNGTPINGIEVMEFGYHPEEGLFGWSGRPLT